MPCLGWRLAAPEAATELEHHRYGCSLAFRSLCTTIHFFGIVILTSSLSTVIPRNRTHKLKDWTVLSSGEKTPG
ncbi:hypothetical protein SISSUDRAFT_397424 [Sistotremastrum suecicum HHB10207 ss-3]|uniref:Uncharacterized protein n=1 Tax=Sistotremastrum suecicum HHB10207 ss-3 TaxID=1314776 RepID=A0A165YSZ8_9AGAM|nr:hypothetical protein SISSUDRAFT_397424 [Sistotremastrum suecicum HHB10207 ss-3]